MLATLTATAQQPQPGDDVTYLLTNPDFESGSYYDEGWIVDRYSGNGNLTSGPFNLDDVMLETLGYTNHCFEAWHYYNFDVWQEVENAPLGVYRLDVQGYVRCEKLDYARGNPISSSPFRIYLNTSTTQLPSVYSEQLPDDYNYIDVEDWSWIDVVNGQKYPNSMGAAAQCFKRDMYKISSYGLITSQNPTLRVGVRADTDNENWWCIWDNFHLTYLGYQADVVKQVLEETLATIDVSLPMGKEAAEKASALIASGNAAITANDGEQMMAVLEQIYEQFEEINASIIVFKELSSAAANLYEALSNSQAAPSTQDEATTLYSTVMTGLQSHSYEDSDIPALIQQIEASVNNLNIRPYAVLSNENTVLTFYCDNRMTQRNGVALGGWTEYAANITSVVFDASFSRCDWLTSTNGWFSGFKSLTELDLSILATSSVTDMKSMFNGCSNLTTIWVGEGWSTAGVTNSTSKNMFLGCTNLVGGNGTTYNENNVNRLYARVDKKNRPGYFTLKDTSADPKDVTYLLRNPDFEGETGSDYAAGWTIDYGSGDPSGGLKVGPIGYDQTMQDGLGYTNHCFESWCYNDADVWQEVQNVSVGVYRLDVQGYVRNENYDYIQGDGIDSSPFRFYINSSTGEFPNVYTEVLPDDYERVVVESNSWDNGYIYGYPNSMGAAAQCFHEGMYDNSIYGIITQEGETMRVGVKVNTNERWWCIWDNFRLTYLGTSPEVVKPILQEALAAIDLTQPMGNTVYTEASALVASANAAIAANDGEQMMAVLAQILEATERINASVALFKQLNADLDDLSDYISSSEAPASAKEEAITLHSTIATGIHNRSYDDSDVPELQQQIAAIKSDLLLQPFAVLSDNNTVLTFYYDYGKTSKGGMDVGPFEWTWNEELQTSIFNGSWYDQRESITHVVFAPSFANYTDLTSTAYWFCDCINLQTITGISNLKTGNVTNMSYMFSNCSSLKSLVLSHFDTGNVRNMDYMFYSCRNLENLDVSNFNTGNVTSMSYMFCNCSSLENLDVSNFDTSKVQNMYAMFSDCLLLASLDLSHFDTGNVRSMSNMFYGCSGLTRLDVSHFNTSKVQSIYYMFSYCSSLTSLDVSHFDTSNVTDMVCMFQGCSSLTSLDVSNFNTSKVTYMHWMFSDCSALESIDVSNFDTGNVKYMEGMFDNCSSLTSLDLSGMTKKRVRKEPWVNLISNGNLEGDDVSNFVTKENGLDMLPSVIVDGEGVDGSRCIKVHVPAGQNAIWDTQFWINLPETLEPNACYRLSFDCRASNDARIWTEAHADPGTYNGDMLNYYLYPGMQWENYTYEGTISQQQSGNGTMHSIAFDLGRNHDVDFYFDNIKFEVLGSEEVDAPLFDTRNVQDMSQMFQGCTDLETIYVPEDWDMSQVTSGSDMFTGCTSLVGGSGTLYDADRTDNTYARIDGGTDSPGYFTLKKEIDDDENEPYAVLNSDNTVLTFYYDDQMKTRGGMKVGPFTSAVFRSWNAAAETITTVVFDESLASCTTITSIAYWFANCTSLTTFEGMKNLKTENVTNMSHTFADCSSLESIDLSYFNTGKVTDMYSLFEGCAKLKALNLSTFNTQKVTTMTAMFRNCTSLMSLDLSRFNTNMLGATYNMFRDCSSLETIYCNDTWPWNNAEDMFLGCILLEGYNEDNVGSWYARPIADGGYFTKILLGDVNGSGDVTPADAIMILYRYFGVEQNGFIEGAADLNGDGSISPADAIEALYLYFGAATNNNGARATKTATGNVHDPE